MCACWSLKISCRPYRKRLRESQLAKGADKKCSGTETKYAASTTYEDQLHRKIDVVTTQKTSTMEYQGRQVKRAPISFRTSGEVPRKIWQQETFKGAIVEVRVLWI